MPAFIDKLEKTFSDVYLKFKMNFYSHIFSQFETREASLTAVETFCAEIIHALRQPTINEFAQFAKISAQNATHKINSLEKKGYITRVRSDDDKREFILEMTDKFFKYYNINASYVHIVVKRMKSRLSADELGTFERVLTIIRDELMPEIDLS